MLNGMMLMKGVERTRELVTEIRSEMGRTKGYRVPCSDVLV